MCKKTHSSLCSSPLASEERHRHLHILVRAAQGLFQGDMSGGVQRFRPLLQFLYEDVVLAPLTLHALPDDSQASIPPFNPCHCLSTSKPHARHARLHERRMSFGNPFCCSVFNTSLPCPFVPQDALLVLCITHLPYYLRDPADFPSVLRTFARAAGDRAPAYTSASADPASPSARPLSPAPTPTTSPLLRIASHPVLPRIASHQSIASAASSDVVSAGSVEAVDFAILELCRYLREVKSEVALYRYLECFEALGGTSIFLQLSDLTRLRLQSEIFDLTVPGGPRYTPYKVRRRAGRALDRLYPSGRFVRKIVRFWFRIVHPGDMVASASRALRRALALSLRLGWRALDALAALPALPARLLRSARIRLPERRIREKVRARSPSPGPSPGQVHGMRWRGDRKSLGADGAAAAMSRARGDDDTSPAGPSGAAGTSFSTATSPSVPSRGWLSPWRYVPSGALGGWAAWAVTRTPLLSRWTTGAGRGLNQHVHVHDRTSPDPPMSLTPSPKPRPILVGLGVSAVSAAGLGTMHAARV